MTVFAPSSADELRAMLDQELALDQPAAIRYPNGSGPSTPEGRVEDGLSARQLRAGSDVCILAVGKLVEAAVEASELLGRHGVSEAVWGVRAVKPLDPAMLAAAVTNRRRPKLPVTFAPTRSARTMGEVPERTSQVFRQGTITRCWRSPRPAYAEGGVGAAIQAALSELARQRGGVDPSVLTLGLPDRFLPQGKPQALLAELGLDGPGLASTVLTALPHPATRPA